jgi:hypothetical protein
MLRTRGLLSIERIRSLDDLGFIWDKRAAAFEVRFNKLVAYKKKHGHTNVPANHPDNRGKRGALGCWVNNLRARKRKQIVTLTGNMIKRLDALGFVWDPADRRWDVMLTALVEFKNKQGHCNVPKGSQLGDWCSTQRVWRRKGRLIPERIEELDALGFEWSRQISPSKDPNICVRGHVGGYKLDSKGRKDCGECRRLRSREKTR